MIKKIVFYLLLTIPNVIRQVGYYLAYKISHSHGFIVSFETKKFYSEKKFMKGVYEEFILGAVFTLFWYFVPMLKFLAYGWLADAVIDSTITAAWMKTKKTFYEHFTKNEKVRFILREILVPYIILGPLLLYMNVNIYYLITIVIAVQAGNLLIIKHFS